MSNSEPDLGVVSVAGAAEILGMPKPNVRTTLSRHGLVPMEMPNGPLWKRSLVEAIAAEMAADVEAREVDERRRQAQLRNVARRRASVIATDSNGDPMPDALAEKGK